MPDDTARWTVSTSKETDIAVCSFLAQRGAKKGDLSRFIEDAVKWRVLDQRTISTVSRNPSSTRVHREAARRRANLGST